MQEYNTHCFDFQTEKLNMQHTRKTLKSTLKSGKFSSNAHAGTSHSQHMLYNEELGGVSMGACSSIVG
jgi:hypothetical protein